MKSATPAHAPVAARQRGLARVRAMVVVVGSVIIWVTLLALPVDFFDHGPALCLSRVLADAECPGCGMTRASMHALHFDFGGAWRYNRLVVVVLPLLAFLWGREIWTLSRRLGWLPLRRPAD